MKLIPNNITLENVKKANLWELIAIIVWNHYREARFQEENMIEVSENWCGKTAYGNSTSFSNDWDNPEFTEKDFIRTLHSIDIKFTRSDYIVYIFIHVSDGNVNVYSKYTDKTNEKEPKLYFGTTDVTNWLLENDLLKVEETKSNIDFISLVQKLKALPMDEKIKFTESVESFDNWIRDNK